MTSIDLHCDRRTALLGTVVAVSSLAAMKVSARGAPRTLHWGDPQFNLTTLTRLEGGLSGRLSYGYSQGQVHGLRNGQGQPLEDYGKHLYDFIGVVIKRSKRLRDGAVETVSRSLLYYTDPATGEFLDRFTNPYTGETVKVEAFAGGISGTVLTANGTKIAANFAMESTVFNRPIRLQYVTVGDRTWIRRHAYTRWQPANHPKARTEMTLDTWVVRTSDLLNPKLDRIPAVSSWTSQTDWQVWLKMPDNYPGLLLWRSDGADYDSLEDLPDAFIKRAQGDHPNFLSDPLEFAPGTAR